MVFIVYFQLLLVSLSDPFHLGGLQISLAMQENHRWSKLERKEKPVYEPALTEGNTEKHRQ